MQSYFGLRSKSLLGFERELDMTVIWLLVPIWAAEDAIYYIFLGSIAAISAIWTWYFSQSIQVIILPPLVFLIFLAFFTMGIVLAFQMMMIGLMFWIAEAEDKVVETVRTAAPWFYGLC